MAKIIILIFVLFSNINSLINITHNHKCGTDTKVIPNEIEEAFFNRNKKLNKRKTNEEKFNIYLELTNIEEEIRLFNLDKYHDMIINSLKIAAETFTSLLKPVYQGCYNLSDTFMDKYSYTHFDKTQFGLDDTKKYGLEGRDSDALYQLMLATEGVQAVVFLRQDTETTCTGGFRSQDEIDVSQVAAKFGGGGHKNASGMSCNGKIETLLPQIVKEFARIM